MSLKERLNAVIEHRRETARRASGERYTLTALELEIVEFCDLRLEPFRLTFYVSLLAGSIAADWDPHVYVIGHQSEDRTYCKIDGKWQWYDGRAPECAYRHQIAEGKPPFDAVELEHVCATLAEEIGIPVRFHNARLARTP